MPTGYGITSNDMAADRLVFVVIKDAKPRRKVAIPLPDGYTWEAFTNQVTAKLKLVGVGAIYQASSGEQVLRLDELQDIDELFVVEAVPPPPVSAAAVASGSNGGATSYTQWSDSGGGASGIQGNGGADAYRQSDQRHRMGVADTEISPLEVEAQAQDSDADAKYVKRQSGFQRSLKRFFPSAFQPTLPVTTRDAVQERPSTGTGRRRRRQRGVLDVRNVGFALVLMTCLGALLYIYSRFAPKMP